MERRRIGLFVALRRPELVDRLVVIGANFHHDGVLPLELGEESPVAAQLFEAYAARSPDGPDHFGELFQKFIAMATTEPTLSAGEIATITAPTLVMVGDDDPPRLAHTCELTRRCPPGSCASYAGRHTVSRSNVLLRIARIVVEFLTAELPPTTLMPIRRATSAAH